MNTLGLLAPALRKAFTEWKLLLVLWAANLVTALAATLPALIPLLARYRSALSSQGKPFLSREVLLDLPRAIGKAGPALGGAILASILFALLLHFVFAGGVISRLWSTERFTLAGFASECARFLGPNLRLSLWSLLGLLPAFGIIGGLSFVLEKLDHDSLLSADPVSWALDTPFTAWSVGHLIFSVLLLALWRASLDAARVGIVAEELRKTRLAAWRGFKLMLRSPLALLAYCSVGALGLFAVLMVAWAHAAIQVHSTGGAWLALLVAQLLILVRLGFELASTAFIAALYRQKRVVTPVAVETAPAVVQPPPGDAPPALAPQA